MAEYNTNDLMSCGYHFSFFPDRVKPVIEVFSNTLYSSLVKIKVCKKVQRHYNLSSPTTITVNLPGTDPQDAERRRYGKPKSTFQSNSNAEYSSMAPALQHASPSVNGNDYARLVSCKLSCECTADQY